MSIFEAVDVRKRIEHEHDYVAKLSQQYIRDTPQGIQCAACGMFVVGPEPRRAPNVGHFLGGRFFFIGPKPPKPEDGKQVRDGPSRVPAHGRHGEDPRGALIGMNFMLFLRL
jgi:hypothetical protein